MKWFLKSLLFLVAMSPFGAIQAKDIVSARIALNFDKAQFKIAEPVPNIPASGIVKLWGWIKLESEGSIEPQTYYLEWEFRDGDRVENLGNYNTNREYLVYRRKLDRADDYYWVSKRVWVQDKGEYFFRVYIKEGKDYKLIKQESVAIKE